MNKEELIALLEAVGKDLSKYKNDPINDISLACTFAIWHLKGEPSFIERHNKQHG